LAAVRDVELYRRPAFLVGDEPAVLRHRRKFRVRRRAVQLAFVGGVVAIGLGLRLAGAGGLFEAAVAFGALSTAFMIMHLAVGKGVWVKPMEAYEDGVVGSHLTVLFSRRQFVAWKDVETVDFGAPGAGAPVLRVRASGSRTLESAPGEFEESAAGAMRGRVEKAKAEAASQRALFDSVGGEGNP
jgi:hypothetical protein